MRIILNSSRRATCAVRLRASFALAVAAGLVLAGCSTSSSGSERSGRVEVVAAENFWGSVARQIAGPDADVTSIITSPDTDPHDYEPTADDARTIATARLVIENGIGYDPWVQKLIDVDGTADRSVLNVGDVVHVPDGGNPHQWYSESAVSEVIERVTQDLARLDPDHRAGYERRTRALMTTGFSQYNALVARIKARYSGTAIGGSESIVALLARTLGLRLITPESFVDAVAEGNEPTASDKATVDAQINNREIKVFVFNRQNATPDVQRLVDAARREHIPIATVTETLVPADATFQQWQASQFRGVLAALAEAERS
jgi:zinc/manganese transport system substrate-binding protein